MTFEVYLRGQPRPARVEAHSIALGDTIVTFLANLRQPWLPQPVATFKVDEIERIDRR